jgi:hypothetical protein
MGYFGYKGMNSFLWIALIEVALVAFIVAAVSSVAVSLATKVRPRPVATRLIPCSGRLARFQASPHFPRWIFRSAGSWASPRRSRSQLGAGSLG